MLSKKIFLGLSILLVGNICASEPEGVDAKISRQEDARAAIVSDLIAAGGEIGAKAAEIEGARQAWLERFAHQNNKAYRLREAIKAGKLIGSSVPAVFNSLCSQNFDLQNLLYDVERETDLLLDREPRESLITHPINDEFEDSVLALRKARIDLIDELVASSDLSVERKIAILEQELNLLLDIFGKQSLVINQLEQQLDLDSVKMVEQKNIDLKNILAEALEQREVAKAARESLFCSDSEIFHKLVLSPQNLGGLASELGDLASSRGAAGMNAIGGKIYTAELSDYVEDGMLFLSATPGVDGDAKTYYVLILCQIDPSTDANVEKILLQTDYPIEVFASDLGLLIAPVCFNKDSVIRYVKYDQNFMGDICITTDLAAPQQADVLTDIGLSFADEIATLTLDGGAVLSGKCSIAQSMDYLMRAMKEQAADWGCKI